MFSPLFFTSSLQLVPYLHVCVSLCLMFADLSHGTSARGQGYTETDIQLHTEMTQAFERKLEELRTGRRRITEWGRGKGEGERHGGQLQWWAKGGWKWKSLLTTAWALIYSLPQAPISFVMFLSKTLEILSGKFQDMELYKFFLVPSFRLVQFTINYELWALICCPSLRRYTWIERKGAEEDVSCPWK